MATTLQTVAKEAATREAAAHGMAMREATARDIYGHILQTRVPEASLWALLAARLAPPALPVSANYCAPSLRTD